MCSARYRPHATRNDLVVAVVDHERRHPDRRQDVAHVDELVHGEDLRHGVGGRARPSPAGPGARAPPARARRGRASSPGPGPSPRTRRPCARVASRSSAVGIHGWDGDRVKRAKLPTSVKRQDPVGIGGGEEDRHRPALGDADEVGPVETDLVHDRPHVVHPGLEVGDPDRTVREARAPLVEHHPTGGLDDRPPRLRRRETTRSRPRWRRSRGRRRRAGRHPRSPGRRSTPRRCARSAFAPPPVQSRAGHGPAGDEPGVRARPCPG